MSSLGGIINNIDSIINGVQNSMSLEVNGITYDGFTSASASKSMIDICGAYSFNISVFNDLEKFPIKLRSECRVLVNGQPFITGYVEAINVDYSSNEHQIAISGRDKTCDIVDNTIGNDLTFSAGISLQNIIKKTLKSFGLDNSITVSSTVDLDVFDSTELGNISSQIGETAFDFIEKYAKKRQVLIMSDGDGNIVLTRVTGNEHKLNTVLTSSLNYQSTILNASITYDDTKRFHKYILSAQKNVMSGIVEDVSAVDNKTIVSMSAIAYDKDIRPTRIYNLLQHDDSYNSQSDLQERAQWESNHRMASGFKYSAVVQGFSPINDPQLIWQPNMLVIVNDEYCNIPGQLLLIKSVSFKYDVSGGSTTTLELIDKDGYSVDVLQGVRYKNKRKSATGKDVSVISDLTPYQGK